MWEYHDGGWWVVMVVSMAIFWGLVLIGLFAVINLVGGGGGGQESPDDALDRRLATGEIDQTQYRALREELHRHSNGPVAPAH